MLEFAGVTAIDTSVAPVTVSDAVPLIDAEVAVIVVVPVPMLVASPAEFTVATEVELEDQVAPTSNCVLPSSKFPMALNCCELPMAMDWMAGITEIELKCALTTVRLEVSVKDPTVAVIVVDPAATVVATAELLMLATEVEDEVQVTPLVKSAVDPSL
jgi:hypothetical protein